ncbi:hypothetical protein E1B28_001012 [Marasmius oreades]|uniref:Uncharacterized protein n=1 Tax=Marasmius oreades TaxID=181124 RepID=A0A9P7V2I5_9AGAR|nr:uncharacterized protein E1B28_001012 [Marasmius oreades]KAG7099141.1 hypothetical protein E1B28_001012 [Marasmius oreades]
MLLLTITILLGNLFTITNAFSFTHGLPTQCDSLNISWTGGTAPFYLLLTPVYGTPRNISITESTFSNGNGSFSLQLPFPQDHKFLITMSDVTGFASGGNTEVLTVGPSNGGSCNTTDPGVGFTYELNSALQQCRTFTFSGYPQAVQPVTMMGIVPGGTSFVFQPPTNSDSYDWVTNVYNGTSMIFLMVDSKGRQGGSSDIRTVSASDDVSCINSNSPSSTMIGSPTSTGTGTSPTSTPSDSKSSTPIAAIAGTVIGGLIFLAVAITLGLFFLKRRKDSRLHNRWDDGTDFRRHSERIRTDIDPAGPLYTPTPYTSNPFFSPSEVEVNNHIHGSSRSYDALPHSATDINPFTAQNVAPSISAAQKKASMAGSTSYKPSRFIVHTDAEDVPPQQEEEETVELPPVYSERKSKP